MKKDVKKKKKTKRVIKETIVVTIMIQVINGKKIILNLKNINQKIKQQKTKMIKLNYLD